MSREASISEWIRRAYREEPGCPPPEAYLAAELAALDEDARQRLESHADSCAACGAERELARAFDEPELARAGYREKNGDHITRRLEQRPPHGRRGWLSGLSSWGAVLQRPAYQLAAVAVLLIGVGIGVRNAVTPPPLTGGPGTSTTRSSALEIEAPLGEIAVAPSELSWQGVPGTVKYVVTVRGVDDRELWKAETTALEVDVDARLAEQLHPAVWYVWSVEAFDRAGSRIAWSSAVRFRISP